PFRRRPVLPGNYVVPACNDVRRGVMSNSPRDSVKDAAQEARKVASEGAGDIQSDLAALRDDVARLATQLADVVAVRGGAVWRKARSNVGDKGMEAVGAVREVGDNIVDAVDESLKRRPYTTLAIAVGIGFLFVASLRRWRLSGIIMWYWIRYREFQAIIKIRTRLG